MIKPKINTAQLWNIKDLYDAEANSI